LDARNEAPEHAGLLAALRDLRLREGLILTCGQERMVRREGRTVVIKPVWRWLLESPEWFKTGKRAASGLMRRRAFRRVKRDAAHWAWQEPSINSLRRGSEGRYSALYGFGA
jgi:hypothetical protein